VNIVLFDTLQARELLKPFSYTRALAKLRVGIGTIEEKWKHYLQGEYSFLTAPYLSTKFPCIEAQDNLCINSTVCPDEVLLKAIKQLETNQKLVKDGLLIAALCDSATLQALPNDYFEAPSLKKIVFEGPLTQIKNNWDIFLFNETELRKDFQWICKNCTTQPIQDRHTIVYNEEAIFIEKGVSTRAAILNAESGPIYIGRNATVQEGAIIKGPVAICEEVQISAGARISNATTLGPYARAGGEINNSVMLGYSNKAHDGFMGNSVIGEWCNLGAGTNTSNLRNDYGKVKAWDERSKEFDTTDLQFCGLFMGDHSKCAINAMFNAGTMVGVSSNLFGVGFFDKVIPSFTRGMPGTRIQTYLLDKALEAAERMTMRRLVQLTKQDQEILTHIFLATAVYRN
jgi:UDP-N-acetylglucosamine diphosphorylase/glucosamine-1-phosphate N-acetyltransferase